MISRDQASLFLFLFSQLSFSKIFQTLILGQVLWKQEKRRGFLLKSVTEEETSWGVEGSKRGQRKKLDKEVVQLKPSLNLIPWLGPHSYSFLSQRRWTFYPCAGQSLALGHYWDGRCNLPGEVALVS